MRAARTSDVVPYVPHRRSGVHGWRGSAGAASRRTARGGDEPWWVCSLGVGGWESACGIAAGGSGTRVPCFEGELAGDTLADDSGQASSSSSADVPEPVGGESSAAGEADVSGACVGVGVGVPVGVGTALEDGDGDAHAADDVGVGEAEGEADGDDESGIEGDGAGVGRSIGCTRLARPAVRVRVEEGERVGSGAAPTADVAPVSKTTSSTADIVTSTRP
jgi:hypothetical protein